MSEEKQIEEMAKDICGVKQSCNDVCHPINSCRALKYAERFYNPGYRKQEWISVDERLPEIEDGARTWGELKIRKSVRVLCACVQKSGKTFVKEGYCEVWGASQRAYWKIPGSIDKVTHWMPLPEPPETQGETE